MCLNTIRQQQFAYEVTSDQTRSIFKFWNKSGSASGKSLLNGGGSSKRWNWGLELKGAHTPYYIPQFPEDLITCIWVTLSVAPMPGSQRVAHPLLYITLHLSEDFLARILHIRFATWIGSCRAHTPCHSLLLGSERSVIPVLQLLFLEGSNEHS